jgi:ribosomal protein L12E/L44/L45/RPP1/RPP2
LTIGEADVTKLLKDAGVQADKDSITQMLARLQGKKVHEWVAEGTPKLATGIAVGGGAAGKYH